MKHFLDKKINVINLIVNFFKFSPTEVHFKNSTKVGNLNSLITIKEIKSLIQTKKPINQTNDIIHKENSRASGFTRKFYPIFMKKLILIINKIVQRIEREKSLAVLTICLSCLQNWTKRS